MSTENNNKSGKAKATLFVRGIPHDATNDQLEAFFSEIGPVRSCFVVMETLPDDKKDIPRTNKGYGFVQFAIPEDAVHAIEELKNKKFRDERILKMELAIKKNTSKDNKKELITQEIKENKIQKSNLKSKAKEYSATIKPRLIIRNLSFFCKKHHLEKAFEKFGAIDYIDVPTKPGRDDLGRGYAFVGFVNEKDAENAMNEMNGKKLLGRPVAIDWSVPRNLYHQIKEKEEKEENEMDVDDDENEDEKDEDDEEEEEEDDDDDNEEEDNDDDDDNDEEEEEDDADDDDDEDDDEDEEKETKKFPEVEERRTLFIRNLSFDTDEQTLFDRFKTFGQLNYAKITKDYETGKSRGTGFLCFKKKEDAEKCLQAYRKAEKSAFPLGEEVKPVDNRKRKEGSIHSVLRPEPMLNDDTAPFILDGRFLKLDFAVRRGEAEQLIHATKLKKRKEDTRNMYLIREGVIFPDSDLGKQLNPSELSKRITSYTSRKQMLAKNPNLFISKTRLSVRNLFPSVDDKTLRQKAKDSVIGYWKEVKANKRKPLEDYVVEEEKEGGFGVPGLKRKINIRQAKILRSKDRIDNETKLGKSKGCGFVEFASHADALACLRYMNNNEKIFEGMNKKRTPIVEFAVENRIILKRREDRLKRKIKNDEDSNKNMAGKKRKREDKSNEINFSKRSSSTEEGKDNQANTNNKNKKRKTDKKNNEQQKQQEKKNDTMEVEEKTETSNKKSKKNKNKNKKSEESESVKKEQNETAAATTQNDETTVEKTEKSKKKNKRNKKAKKAKSKREQQEAKEDKQFNQLLKIHGKSNLIKPTTSSSNPTNVIKNVDFSGMKKWFE